MKLKQLISEVLINKGIINESDCNCGPIKRTKAPILNENLAPREILSEGLQYHIDNKKPLTEHVYRAGSQAYFNLWAEARALYARGILDFYGDDLVILTETHLGEFGIYEGKKVPLDFIMEEEENTDMVVSVLNNPNLDKDVKTLLMKAYEKGDLTPSKVKDIVNNLLKEELDEAKKAKKKNPPLNKPKRGGSKKFYVYVRDPKTKNIKKVSFGAPGMSVGFRDPKRRKAFAARHDCKNKTDRTKPSYWSCRVGRYAKQLGLGKNFSGFW